MWGTLELQIEGAYSKSELRKELEKPTGNIKRRLVQAWNEIISTAVWEALWSEPMIRVLAKIPTIEEIFPLPPDNYNCDIAAIYQKTIHVNGRTIRFDYTCRTNYACYIECMGYVEIPVKIEGEPRLCVTRKECEKRAGDCDNCAVVCASWGPVGANEGWACMRYTALQIIDKGYIIIKFI